MEPLEFVFTPTKDKSIRLELVELITKKFIENSLFDKFNNFDVNLQIELNKHLGFETKVLDVVQTHKEVFGKILVMLENNETRIINFTIEKTAYENKTYPK